MARIKRSLLNQNRSLLNLPVRRPGTPPYRYVWIIGDSRAFSSSNTYIKWDYTITGNERLIVTDDNERDLNQSLEQAALRSFRQEFKSCRQFTSGQTAYIQRSGKSRADYPSAFANRFWVNGTVMLMVGNF